MLRMVIWILGSAQLLSTLCLASLGEEVGEAILGGGEAVKGDDGDDGLTMQDFSRFASRCSAAAGRCSPAEAVRFTSPVIITFLISVGSVGFCGLELSLSISGSTALSPCMMYRILSASCPPMRRTDMAGDVAGFTL
jgi:hypothetical protein